MLKIVRARVGQAFGEERSHAVGELQAAFAHENAHGGADKRLGTAVQRMRVGVAERPRIHFGHNLVVPQNHHAVDARAGDNHQRIEKTGDGF